jgi:hypothetical protein
MISRQVLFLFLLEIFPSHAADPPVMLFQEDGVHDAEVAGGSRTAVAFMRLPNGGFAFYDRYSPKKGPLSLPDMGGTLYPLLPHLPEVILGSEAILESGILNNTQVILAEDGEVKGIRVQSEALEKEEAARVGLPRYLNTWIHRAGADGIHEPVMTWQGYNGSQMEYQQLPGGRLLVPHGSFLPHARAVPPTGRHETIIQFSDDGGRTWKVSQSRLTAPCYPEFNGSNEGACEPAFELLEDGRLWMMMRTTAGFLYESFSSDNGTTWTPACASRFNTSSGPPNIMRHRNGSLIVCWNNCEMPPRANGEGVYGGRDALHIAISRDEGATWRGFREIYLDHRRNDNPAKTGDRGTAYPLGAYTSDGRILVIAGQGKGGRQPILIDPEWIEETEATTDFSDGLAHWSTYTHHGPARRWWRARASGAALADHPDDKKKKCLHVRKQPDLPGDGATWNFPNGWKGSLSIRVMTRTGSRGGVITLNDRFFDPANDLGEEFSVFRVSLDQLDLVPNQWSDLRLDWNLAEKSCFLSINGKKAFYLPQQNPTLNGLSYLRFRSTATEDDPVGLLVENVTASITDPFAPACTTAEQREQEKRYVERVVPRWSTRE